MNVISPPSSLLRSVFPSTLLLPLVSLHSLLLLLLAAEFLSSFAVPDISSFCYSLPFLLCHCCPLPPFFDLKFNVSSLSLMHLGTSPLMNRGSFLPPPLPFIHTLKSSSGCCSFFVFLMHEGKSPSTCLSLCLPSTFYSEIFMVLIFMHHFFSSTTHSRPFFSAADPHIPTAHSRCYKFF